jgi:hypothetical protein
MHRHGEQAGMHGAETAVAFGEALAALTILIVDGVLALYSFGLVPWGDEDSGRRADHDGRR